jgi:hypothetical protein
LAEILFVVSLALAMMVQSGRAEKPSRMFSNGTAKASGGGHFSF